MASIKRERKRQAKHTEQRRYPLEGTVDTMSRFTPNPVKRKCGRCERLRAYARRMLAKVSGTA